MVMMTKAMTMMINMVMTITMMILLMMTNDDRYDKNDDEEGDNDNDDNDHDDNDDDDIYIIMKCLFVGVSRKIITSPWEFPVTT